MISFFINNEPFKVPKNLTVLQAIEYAGYTIPHFCYHENLLIAGNCRMCLVEVENVAKPIASCAFFATENLKIFTNSPFIQKIRENVLEFLLINHPLDCPICDQGGECDLQELSMFFGSDRSRFFDNKRTVSDKIFNDFIKSIMTRCIHCTRCVRFVEDVTSSGNLGTLGRGSSTEIGQYSFKPLKSELSGNIIDLCPVGALTSKPFSFKSRPWELRSFESVDFFDSLLTPVNFFFKNSEILKVKVLKNFEINNVWISDRIRFCIDSFYVQRLEVPLIKVKNQFIKTSWKVCFIFLKKNLIRGSISGVFGDLVDFKTLFFYKLFLNKLGSSNIISDNFLSFTNFDFLKMCKFNTPIEYYKFADLVFLVGVNPRFEASLVNSKLNEAFNNKKKFKCYSVGKILDLNFSCTNLGWNILIFFNVIFGKSKLSKSLLKSVNPKILLNSSFQNLTFFMNFTKKINPLLTFSFISLKASSLVSNFLGFDNSTNKLSTFFRSNCIFLTSSSFTDNFFLFDNKFIIFQGSFAIPLLYYSNIVFPTFNVLEKRNCFLNHSNYFIYTENLNYIFSSVRDDFIIFYSFLNFLFKFKSIKLFKSLKSFLVFNLSSTLINTNFYRFNKINIKNIQPSVKNFYLSSRILYLSLTLRKCSKTILLHRYSYNFYNNPL